MAEYSNIKLVCMDMDGTLLSEGKIPQINLYALKECDKRGIKLALVSGRNYRFLMASAEQISPNTAIVSANGARIDLSPRGKCIYEGTFEPKDAKRTSEVLFSTGVYFEIYTDGKNYVFNREKISEIHKHSLELYIKNRQILGLEFPKTPMDAEYTGIYKFVAFSDFEGMTDKVKNALDAAQIAHSSSWRDNVEVMAPGVDKGNAVRILAKSLGVELKDVMAFGDYTNDISLLRAAGCPVAMENEVDELKREAKLIAPANGEGGVGKTLLKYVLDLPAI